MKKASFVSLVLMVLAANSLVLAQPAKVLLLEPETEDALFSLACDVHIWMKASFGKNENFLVLLDLKQARDTLAKKGIYLSRCKTNNDYYKVGGVLHANKIIYTKLYSIDQQYIFSATVFDVINKQVLYQKETDVNIAYKKDLYDFTNNAVKELADTIFNIPNNILGKEEDTTITYGDFGLKKEGLDKLRALSDIIGKEEFDNVLKAKYKKTPVLKKSEKIFYPDSIRSKGIGGLVNLYALVNEEGNISRIELAQSSNSTLLDSLAKQAVHKFEYSPGIDSNGMAQKVWILIHVDFDLIKGAAEYGEFKAMEETPEIVKKVAPIYPPAAKANGDQGRVILYLLIDIDGRVKRVDIAISSGSTLLDEAATTAARQFIFTPAIAPGHIPVRVWIMYPVSFSLE